MVKADNYLNLDTDLAKINSSTALPPVPITVGKKDPPKGFIKKSIDLKNSKYNKDFPPKYTITNYIDTFDSINTINIFSAVDYHNTTNLRMDINNNIDETYLSRISDNQNTRSPTKSYNDNISSSNYKRNKPRELLTNPITMQQADEIQDSYSFDFCVVSQDTPSIDIRQDMINITANQIFIDSFKYPLEKYKETKSSDNLKSINKPGRTIKSLTVNSPTRSTSHLKCTTEQNTPSESTPQIHNSTPPLKISTPQESHGNLPVFPLPGIDNCEDKVIFSKKFIEDTGNTENVYFQNKKITLFKTEMCRSFTELGICKYGEICQFSHSYKELRDVKRHPKYKTEICKTFWKEGSCPYGTRCCFIHKVNRSDSAAVKTSNIMSVEVMATVPTKPEVSLEDTFDDIIACNIPTVSIETTDCRPVNENIKRLEQEHSISGCTIFIRKIDPITKLDLCTSLNTKAPIESFKSQVEESVNIKEKLFEKKMLIKNEKSIGIHESETIVNGGKAELSLFSDEGRVFTSKERFYLLFGNDLVNFEKARRLVNSKMYDMEQNENKKYILFHELSMEIDDKYILCAVKQKEINEM